MVKTRSQALNLPIKKEEHREESISKNALYGINNASSNTKSNKNKVVKKETTYKTRAALRHTLKAKSENTDVKISTLYPSPPIRTSRNKNKITSEQIEKLIGYIVNDNLAIVTAARKAKMCSDSAQYYYQEYLDDPEHKIPLPKTGFKSKAERVTQDKINTFIKYIVEDKMCMTKAAVKAYISRHSASKYYRKYLNDPERKIPLLSDPTAHLSKCLTQEKINKLINCIVNDNMTVAEASRKASMAPGTGKKYYLKYLQDPNHKIPTAGTLNYGNRQSYTNDQVKQLIHYIEDDGMTTLEASVKANVSLNTAKKYYRQYLDDPNHKIPTPQNNPPRICTKRTTVEQLKNFFTYIIIDKMDVPRALQKANISHGNGYKYYEKYLKEFTKEYKDVHFFYSKEKMKKLISYIQKDKMSVTAAAKKVNLTQKTAFKYYRQYLENPEDGIPKIQIKSYSYGTVKKLINYVERDKMSIPKAAVKVNMTENCAYRYCKIYKEDPEHKIPKPTPRGYGVRTRTFDKYASIIADIYKNNPLIEPPPEYLQSCLGLTYSKIKKECFENSPRRRSKRNSNKKDDDDS